MSEGLNLDLCVSVCVCVHICKKREELAPEMRVARLTMVLGTEAETLSISIHLEVLPSMTS